MLDYITAATLVVLLIHFARCAFRVTVRQAVKQKPATAGEVLDEMLLPLSRPLFRAIDKLGAALEARRTEREGQKP